MQHAIRAWVYGIKGRPNAIRSGLVYSASVWCTFKLTRSHDLDHPQWYLISFTSNEWLLWASVLRDGLEGAAIVRMRRVPPRYPPALWNVHQATMDDESRTNNQCEGWSNRFTNLVGYLYPSVWTMIDVLKKEDAVACIHIAKDLNDQSHKKRIRRKCKDVEILQQAGRRTVPELLRRVGHNTRWEPMNRENDD